MKQRVDTLKSNGAKGFEIERLENSCEQAERYFERNYHIKLDGASAEVQRIEAEAESMGRADERLQGGLAPLVEKREVFKQEYQRQKSLLDSNPEGEKIQSALERLDKESRGQDKSVREKLARVKAEREIDGITQPQNQPDRISTHDRLARPDRTILPNREMNMVRNYERER
jgi:hypothetical protein